MTDELKKAYNEYIDLGIKIKELTEERDSFKALIYKYHDDQHKEVIEEDGFKSVLTTAVRNTLDKKLVEEELGVTVTDACYKHSEYKNFKCGRTTIVEDK